MAKKDVTLSREQWAIVFNQVRGYPAPQDTEGQVKQHRLYEYLRDALKGVDNDPITVPFVSGQRKMVNAMMGQPLVPWKTEALPRIWAIREPFGFRLPDPEDDDEDDE